MVNMLTVIRTYEANQKLFKLMMKYWAKVLTKSKSKVGDKKCKSLWIGASGMNAQQEKIDVIAHNLANIQTTGYKKQHVSFLSYCTRP